MMNKKTIVYIAQPTHGGAIEYLYMFLKNIDKYNLSEKIYLLLNFYVLPSFDKVQYVSLISLFRY